MKHFLFFVGFLLPFFARAATGSIVSATIETNGYIVKLVLENMATNQSWTLASTQTTNGQWMNIPLPSAPYVTFDSPGYVGAGTEYSWAEKAYLQAPVRWPYPSEAYYETSPVDSTNVYIKVYLSTTILQADTNVVLTIPQGFYGGMLSNQTVNVVNSSTQPAVMPIGNWTHTPPYTLIRSNTFDCHIQSYHWSAADRPVAGVSVTAKDANGTTVTASATNLTFMSKPSLSGIKYPEYVIPITMTGFTSGPVRFDFTSWPRRGRAWLSTTGDVNVLPTEKYAAHTNYYAPNWITVHAYVAVAGSDTTGAAATNSATAAGTPFRNISKALSAAAALNNTHNGDNSVAGVIVHVNSGEAFAYPGTSQTYGNVPKHWAFVQTDSGTQAELSGFSGGTGARLVRFNNMKMNPTSVSTITPQIHWYDGCWFAVTNTSAMTGSGGVFYFTDSGISAYGTSLGPPGTGTGPIALMRGNSFTNYSNPVRTQYFIGNRRVGTNALGGSFLQVKSVNTTTGPVNWIASFNELLQIASNTTSGNYAISAHSNADVCAHGGAVVGNIVEQIEGSVGGTIVLAADGTTAAVTNLVMIANTLQGKVNIYYNDNGSTAYPHALCLVTWNHCSDINIKADTYGGAGRNGGRVGNWNNFNGVNWRYNYFGEHSKAPDSAGAPGILGDYVGLWSIVRNNGYNWNDDKPWDNQAGTGNNFAAGLGNYRLKPISYLQGYAPAWAPNPIQYGLGDGRPRGRNSPPGTYGSSSSTTAGMLGL